MIMAEQEMDEQLDIIEDLWAEVERAECEDMERRAEIEEAYIQGASEFADWLEENCYEYIDSFWGGHSICEALEDWKKEGNK